MSEKKRTMNDMIVNKKPVIKKQVFRAPQPEIRLALEKKVPDPISSYEEVVPRKNRSGCLLWIIAGICIGALVVGIGGLFTYAEIVMTPKQLSGQIDVTVTLSQTREHGALFFGTATKTFTSEKVVPSIGQASSEVKAMGMVKFYNPHTTSKTIPAKTEIVSSAGKKYTLNKAITIPAKKATTPGQIEGAITAVVAGGEGNSGLDDFTFSKPSKTLLGITMHSVGEITGGANSSDLVADPQAIAMATELLKQEFAGNKNFVARLSEQVPDSMIALPLVLPESPVSITTDPKHADGVHIIASQTVSILVVNRSDIARVLGDDLNVSKDIILSLTDFGDVTAMTSGVAAGQPIPQRLQIRMTGDGQVIGLVDAEEIKKNILGISRKEARVFMNQIDEIGSYKITMRPFWRRTLPVNAEDVEVVD
jgi:hypothetical protein